MVINIISGTLTHLQACNDAYVNSRLGQVYSPPEELFKSRLAEGINKGHIFVAVNEDHQCLGFIWIELRGVFNQFPYCKLLAVKEQFRSQGIGTALLNYFERVSFSKATKTFILVSDFNQRAHQLYKRLGYTDVGLIPNLFQEGVSEHMLMKLKPEKDVT
ncbi:MAG: GNAT family N-acetyltransferase [Firmicutes bacterium]|nr:GNAT family N-acetyltransferase [Bacillota bacterium]